MKREKTYTGLLLIFSEYIYSLVLPELKKINYDYYFSIIFNTGPKKLTKKKLLNLIKSRRNFNIVGYIGDGSQATIRNHWLTNANKVPFLKVDIPKSMIEVLPSFEYYEEFPIKFNINSEDGI